MNPLIKKFEEVYGKKPVEGGLIEQLAGAEGSPDVISLGGDTVIPTAQKMPGGGINLTGDYIDTASVLNVNPAYISNGITSINPNSLTSYTRGISVPHQTPVEQQFFKVLEDVSKGRATVSAISADIDQSFTGFGGQIRYTVEIVGRYP
jgi:hypothetical protein